MSSKLKLAERARDSALTGFTLDNAIGEALGAASVCWDEDRVFDSVAATEIWADLRAAIAKFTQIAINQQSIDAGYGAADWEIAELIFQAPAMGFDAHESDATEPPC